MGGIGFKFWLLKILIIWLNPIKSNDYENNLQTVFPVQK
jgi:hypothetical protein